MEVGRNRDLLADWLNSLGRYAVETCGPEESLPEAGTYDLCLLDRTALSEFRTELLAHKRAVDPVFLPCLLMASSNTGESVLSSLDLGDDARSLIDETLSLPVDQPVLRRRIDNLLSARRSALRLRERKHQYEELVNLTPEAILILHDRDIVYSNAAAAEVFAETGSDSAGGEDVLDSRRITTLVTEDDQSEFEQCLREIEREGGTGTFRNLTMQTVTGEPIEAEVAGARITFGDAPATQLLVRDVTEEYQRREQLSLFGRAIQTSVQGVTIADAKQDNEPLIYANTAFETITGYPTAEVLGRNCRFLQGERTDPDTVSRIREAITERKPINVEILNYRKDGTPFWNQLDIVPVADDEGDVTHFLGLQRDITDRKAREERLEVLDRVLRHNLRNRMNVIVGNAERLQTIDDTDDAGAIGETIRYAAEELLDISEQIREFNSLINENHQELEPVDLVTVFEQVIEGFRSEYPEASVRLESPETAVVAAHPLLPAAVEELFALVVDNGETVRSADIGVAISAVSGWIEVEIRYGEGLVSEDDLRVIEKETETPTDHPQGLEPWLVRWAVLNSDGEVSTSSDDSMGVTLRFRRWSE